MSEYELYLNLALEMILKIEESAKKVTKDEFLKNMEIQDATLMRLQVIGENIKKIPFKIKKENKSIKWKKFEKLRNLISHKYNSIEYLLIWDFIEKNLNELKEALIKIKQETN